MINQIHILTVAVAVAEPSFLSGSTNCAKATNAQNIDGLMDVGHDLCLIQARSKLKNPGWGGISLASKSRFMTLTRPSPEHAQTEDVIDDSTRSRSDHSIISLWAYEADADIASNFEPFQLASKRLKAQAIAKVNEMAGVLMKTSKPSVVFLRAHENNFRIEQSFLAAIGSNQTAPFVLLIRSADHPFPVWLQNQFKMLKSMRACYVTNLLTSDDKLLFHPLPVGVSFNEYQRVWSKTRMGVSTSLVEDTANSAQEWKFRKNRILFPPLTIDPKDHPSRARYSQILRQKEYRDLVDIHEDRLEGPEYLSLLAQYKAVLSPPGVGYDCFRTWEALAVGSVPLVMRNDSMDERLFKGTDIRQIPPPEELTPQGLRELLSTMESPSPFTNKLSMNYWLSIWASHLSEGPRTDSERIPNRFGTDSERP